MTEPRKRIPPNEFVALLGLLNRPSVQYPPELLAARRAGFIAQVQAAQPTTTGDTSVKGNSPASQTMGASKHVLETVLQYVLAAMVVVLISTLAYVYRDKLRDLLTGGEVATEVQIVDTPVPQPATEITIPSETATEPPTSVPALATPKPDEEQPDTENPPPETELPPPEPTQPEPTQPQPTQPEPTQPQPTPTKPGVREGHTKTPKPDKK